MFSPVSLSPVSLSPVCLSPVSLSGVPGGEVPEGGIRLLGGDLAERFPEERIRTLPRHGRERIHLPVPVPEHEYVGHRPNKTDKTYGIVQEKR